MRCEIESSHTCKACLFRDIYEWEGERVLVEGGTCIQERQIEKKEKEKYVTSDVEGFAETHVFKTLYARC